MNQNIKEFLQQGEKEFEEKFKIYPIGEFSEQVIPNSAEKESIKDYISSRQISLIKMIVEMVESEKKDYMFEEGNPKHEEFEESMEYHETMGEAHEEGFNSALSTISSNLKDLIK